MDIMDINKLYEDNEKLVYFVVNKHFKKRLHDEDFLQICRIGLWRACEIYDPTRGTKISTLAVKVIYTEALKYIRLEKQYQRFDFVDNEIPKPEGNVSIFNVIEDDRSDNVITQLKAHELFNRLDKQCRDIVRLTVQGYTQKEQSEILVIPQSGISRKLQGARKLAKEIF